jgi:peptidase E
MTKYIFHGGGLSLESDSNHGFYKEIVKDIPVNGTVLLVYFASRSDDNSERIALDTTRLKELTGKPALHILIANETDFISQIKESDAIFIRGGSTEKLLNILYAYPDLKNSFEGKTIAGSSAGAYALSTFYSSHYEDCAAEGLGIVPVRVVTHYKSEKMPPKAAAIEALQNAAPELKLIMLKEGEWEVVIV